jgi:hypothetical protein
LIEEQVRQAPKKIAVSGVRMACDVNDDLMNSCKLQFEQDVFITYQDMDSLSNDLASWLITNGVKQPGTGGALYGQVDRDVFVYSCHAQGWRQLRPTGSRISR